VTVHNDRDPGILRSNVSGSQNVALEYQFCVIRDTDDVRLEHYVANKIFSKASVAGVSGICQVLRPPAPCCDLAALDRKPTLVWLFQNTAHSCHGRETRSYSLQRNPENSAFERKSVPISLRLTYASMKRVE